MKTKAHASLLKTPAMRGTAEDIAALLKAIESDVEASITPKPTDLLEVERKCRLLAKALYNARCAIEK